MEENTLKALQSKLLDLLKIFHAVCEKHQLSYYMIGGTMLGAARHSGFIPWDDDADIGMPRDDYQRLLDLPEEEWPYYVHLKTPYNSTDLIIPYSKLMNKNTTLVEDYSDGIVGGIFIDIFPLDGLGNRMLLTKLQYLIFFWKKAMLYMNQNKYPSTILKKIARYLSSRDNAKDLLISAEKIMKFHDFSESTIIGNFSSGYGLKEIMPKSFFGKPTIYKFEDSEFYGVQNPHDYLSFLYQDYMTFPPVETRGSHHKFIFLDLNMPFHDYKLKKPLNKN